MQTMQTEYDISNLPNINGANVAILQAKWYKEITDNLIVKCVEILEKSGCHDIEQHLISGSLELPLAAQTLIKHSNKKYDAIICVGAILKGETMHFNMIVDECTRGLGQVMLNCDTPIIVEVMPILNVQQLKVRCANDNFNKGIEAAITTVETIAWRRKIIGN